MAVQVVLVHGIRTSATMWRAQRAHLDGRDIAATAIDLPGHGTRMGETFTLEGAFETIDTAVRTAAERGPVVLAAHSMGGLISCEYVGAPDPPPVAAFVAASCTAIPRGVGLATYRALARRFDSLPDRGMRLTEMVLARTLPDETRSDFGAGGYAFDAQDIALRSLSMLDLMHALRHIRVPTWFVNGQFDQLRANERLFQRLVPHAELIVVPRTSHLVTAMRPRVFNAVLDLAIATVGAAPAPDTDPARARAGAEPSTC
ncbi:alpha/beta fold hydrolase [Microbacterium sp. HA-8]|uniref:alpha/beta fold hydrolase n=1 Tax=Microbacterium sp. HA-8 TaxID=3234200 RepID=UPI0038F7DEA4